MKFLLEHMALIGMKILIRFTYLSAQLKKKFIKNNANYKDLFDPSMMVHFRQRLDMIAINELICQQDTQAEAEAKTENTIPKVPKIQENRLFGPQSG